MLLAMQLVSLGFSANPAVTTDNAEDVFKAGVNAFQSGNFAEATKDFEAVLALAPQGDALETILFSLAGTYYNNKNLVKAEECYKRVLKEFPNGSNKTKALIALSQIQLQTGRKEEAAKTLKLASSGTGDLAAQAKIAEAGMLASIGKPAEAITELTPMIAGGIKDKLSVQAAMALIEIESKQGKVDDAMKLLDQLQSAGNLVENPLELDFMAVRIGDGLLSQGERRKALKMYAIVRPRDVVMNLQKERIATLDKQIADNRASLQSNPKAFMEVNATNGRLQSERDNLQKVLDDFSKMPDPEIPVRIRQAKAYDELDQKWENILIWENILSKTTDPKVREDGLFTLGASYCALGRADDTVAAVEKYLSEYPSGKYASQANYLKGAVLMEGGNFVKAESVFGQLMAKGDTSAVASDMQFLLANCQFAQACDATNPNPSKYKQAIESYKKYLDKYPTGKFAEESFYRVALCYFQLGDYASALDAFQAYEKKYPEGTFSGDSGYRIALCYNAANKYDEVLSRCDAWIAKHSGQLMHPEILALKGDAFASKDMTAESADAYRRSVEMSDSDELIKYSLFKANEQYQKLNDWDDIIGMFSKFVQMHPKHPASIAAIYWVSKAKIKQGKSEEAKKYLADNILININDRWKDAVEQLISQLAQTCSKRPRPPLIPKTDPSPSPTSDASSTNAAVATADQSPASRPSPTPPPPYDAEADFAKYLNSSNVGTNPTAQARLLFGQAELEKFTKHPDREKELLTKIYTDFQADQLSAMLLANSGDVALDRGELDKAAAFYNELMTSFPKSDLLEYAYDGMGNVELSRHKPAEALYWFDGAINQASADAKLADVTYGKGVALLMEGKTDEAKKIFEQVAATKEWRGEITAKALLSMGDMEMQRGNTDAAIQYYQRVFVAYQRYPNVVIPAYLKTADAFIKLGSPEKAAAHLRELLANPKLNQSPLAEPARKKLESLPPPPAPTASPSHP
jgi:TolA-binding protein